MFSIKTKFILQHFIVFLEKGKAVNKTTVSLWVDSEKFLPFMFITDSNVNELADSGTQIECCW